MLLMHVTTYRPRGHRLKYTKQLFICSAGLYHFFSTFRENAQHANLITLKITVTTGCGNKTKAKRRTWAGQFGLKQRTSCPVQRAEPSYTNAFHTQSHTRDVTAVLLLLQSSFM